MMSNKRKAILWLSWGIIALFLFIYQFIYYKNYFIWLLLLTALISFLRTFFYWKQLDKKEIED